jgi:hypothetical protein
LRAGLSGSARRYRLNCGRKLTLTGGRFFGHSPCPVLGGCAAQDGCASRHACQIFGHRPGSAAGPGAGAAGPTLGAQQRGQFPEQFTGEIKFGTIGDHVGSSARLAILQEACLPRAPRTLPQSRIVGMSLSHPADLVEGLLIGWVRLVGEIDATTTTVASLSPLVPDFRKPSVTPEEDGAPLGGPGETLPAPIASAGDGARVHFRSARVGSRRRPLGRFARVLGRGSAYPARAPR